MLVYDKKPLPAWQDTRRTLNVHSLYWVHEGRGIFTLEENDLSVHAGSFFYLKPGRELLMKSSFDHPLHMSMILFETAAVTLEHGVWSAQPLTLLDIPETLVFEGTDKEEMESRVKAVRVAWAPGDDWREAAANHQLLKLLKHLVNLGKPGSVAGKPEEAGYRQVKAHMDTHYFSDIRLQEAALQHGISPKSLRRRFLQETGMAPKEYLDQIRYEHAVRLLAHTDEPLKRIAAACGYYDEFHFSKSFKKRNGIAPSIFRSRQRQR
jgi:AraC-like DNA-binding protein